MYESPITIKTEEIARNIMDKQEEYILTQVQMCVDVDKDELIKALEYDRGQYEKGYADGRASATKHGHWMPHPNPENREWDVCSSCGTGCKRREYHVEFMTKMEWETQYNYPFCPNCGAKMEEAENV